MFNENGNITFDFLVNQMEVLSEMARPMSNPPPGWDNFVVLQNKLSNILKTAKIDGKSITPPNFSEIVNQINNDIERQNKLEDNPSKARQPLQLTEVPGLGSENIQVYLYYYLLWTVMETIDGEAPLITNNGDAVSVAKSLGIELPPGPSGRGPQAPMASIKKLTTDNPSVLSSKLFEQKLLDPNRISDFLMTRIAKGVGSNTKWRAQTKATMHGVDDISDIIELQSSPIFDKIKKINKEQGIRDASKNKTKEPITRKTPPNPFENSSQIYKTTLKKIRDLKNLVISTRKDFYDMVEMRTGERYNSYKELVSEVPSSDIVKILKAFAEDHDPAFILSLIRTNTKELDRKFEELRSLPTKSLSWQDVQNMFSNKESIIDQKLLGSIEKRIYTKAMDADDEGGFGRFDADIVNRHLTTPEERAEFRRYAQMKQNQKNWKEYDDSLKRITAAYERMVPDSEKGSNKNDFRQPKTMTDEEILNSLSPEERDALNMKLSSMSNPLQIKKAIQNARKKLETDKTEPVIKSSEEPSSPEWQEDIFGNDEDEETSVFRYMSEQVQKDNLHKPKGKFVERGFKKVKNYNQWFLINQ